ncbi:MAG: SpoIIE family protein phosphatase [Thermogutta sp.]
MPGLHQTEGPDRGKIYPIEKNCVILGRHPSCDIVLEIRAVSRQHARIVRTGSRFFLEDLNSRNGTFLNGQRVHGRQPLKGGDQIRICDLVFVFFEGAAPGEKGEETHPLGAAWVDDEERFRSKSTVMSRFDVTTTGSRVEVNPEAKLRALIEISQNLGKAISVDEVLDKILTSLFNVFTQADRGFVILVDSETGKLVPRAVKTRRPEDREQLRISRTIVNSVIASKQAVLSADVATDSRFDLSQSIADFPIHSVMCVPLVGSDGKVLGVIQVDTRERKARFTLEDLEVLVSAASQVAVSVENAILHDASMREELLRRELALAHKVQQGFLPSEPPKLPEYAFFDFYDPAHEVGGDYYDYIFLPANRLAVIMADVSGKGIAAALLMAKLSAEIKYCLASEASPQAALRRLNKVFCSDRWDDRFITLLLVVLDPITHHYWLVNAGHWPALLKKNNGEVRFVGTEKTGPPLGVSDDTNYDCFVGVFEPGDLLILFTDGIVDAMNVNDEAFGQERVIEVLRRSSGSPENVGNNLVEAVHRFVGQRPQIDDMCLVVVGREDRMANDPSSLRREEKFASGGSEQLPPNR